MAALLIVSSTLVSRYKQVLRAISENSIWSNKIVQHTGVTWSRPIHDAIKELEKADLITREKRRKRGEKIHSELTTSGRELLYLIEVIDAYEAAISKLDNMINERILIIDEDHLSMLNDLQGLMYKIAMQNQNNPIATTHSTITDNEIANKRRLYEYRLKEVGWPDKQIEFYNECRFNAISFKIFCDQYYEYVLLLRYASIISTFDSNISSTIKKRAQKHAQKIINIIIQDAVNKRVIYKMGNIRKHPLGYAVIYTDVTAERTSLISKRIGAMDDLFSSLYKILIWRPIPNVIYDEVKNILMVYLALLKPYALDLSHILQDDLYTAQPAESRMLIDEQRFPIMVNNVDSYGKKESELSTKSKPKSRSESEQEDKMKVVRYRALLQASKEFVDGICREYCNRNVQRVKHIKKEISYVKIPYYYCIDRRTNA